VTQNLNLFTTITELITLFNIMYFSRLTESRITVTSMWLVCEIFWKYEGFPYPKIWEVWLWYFASWHMQHPFPFTLFPIHIPRSPSHSVQKSPWNKWKRMPVFLDIHRLIW